MADPKYFLAKAGLLSSREKKSSILLEAIQMDELKIKHLSREGMAPLVIKMQKMLKTKPNSNVIDSVLQLDKRGTGNRAPDFGSLPITQSTPKLETAESTKEVSRMSPVGPGSSSLHSTPIPHGFRYHCNGDERVHRKPSSDSPVYYTGDRRSGSSLDVDALRQQMLRATLIHSRDMRGEYTASPYIKGQILSSGKSSRKGSRLLYPMNIAPHIPVSDLSISASFRPKHTIVFRKSRAASEANMERSDSVSTSKLIGKGYLIRENDKFRHNMFRHITELDNVSTTAGGRNWQSDPVLPARSARVVPESSLRSLRSDRNPTLTPAKSSFHMRFGVPTKTLALRKQILDEYMEEELQRASEVQADVDKYIMDMKEIAKAKERKKLVKGTKLSWMIDDIVSNLKETNMNAVAGLQTNNS